jgi:hypothetical protein
MITMQEMVAKAGQPRLLFDGHRPNSKGLHTSPRRAEIRPENIRITFSGIEKVAQRGSLAFGIIKTREFVREGARGAAHSQSAKGARRRLSQPPR